jgi:hypothetical protein
MKFLVLACSLLFCFASFSQTLNENGNRAQESIQSSRMEMDRVIRTLPFGSMEYQSLKNADRYADDASQFVRRMMEQPTVQVKKFVCIIVDGKGNVSKGESNNQAEAQQMARSGCRECGKYPTIHESCDARPTQYRCQVIDGKNHVYSGEGATQTDALVQPYAQCGVICTKYPHRKECVAITN